MGLYESPPEVFVLLLLMAIWLYLAYTMQLKLLSYRLKKLGLIKLKYDAIEESFMIKARDGVTQYLKYNDDLGWFNIRSNMSGKRNFIQSLVYYLISERRNGYVIKLNKVFGEYHFKTKPFFKEKNISAISEFKINGEDFIVTKENLNIEVKDLINGLVRLFQNIEVELFNSNLIIIDESKTNDSPSEIIKILDVLSKFKREFEALKTS
jgi:hypothetical protein